MMKTMLSVTVMCPPLYLSKFNSKVCILYDARIIQMIQLGLLHCYSGVTSLEIRLEGGIYMDVV